MKSSWIHPQRAASFKKIFRYRDDLFIVTQGPPIDGIVQRSACRVLDPTVDGCYEPEPNERFKKQPEHVALIIVSVPNLDIVATANLVQVFEERQQEGAVVIDLNQGTILLVGTPP